MHGTHWRQLCLLGGYGATEAAEAMGVSYRILDYWAREDILVPMLPAGGSGHVRRYSDEDVAVGRALRALGALGAKQDVLRAVNATLRRLAQPWPERVVVSSKGDVASWPAGGTGWQIPLAA